MNIHLAETLLAILRAHPDGLSEHDLIRKLARDDPAFGPDAYTDKLSLFQCHFILFHHLYRLRDDLWNERQGDLAIHCLKIALHPCTPAPTAPTSCPPPPTRCVPTTSTLPTWKKPASRKSWNYSTPSGCATPATTGAPKPSPRWGSPIR